ncbi:MAG: hypothetical protein RBT75_17525 [Anaerolineae bacterium]|jgi:hypothetical protein|nr:hypothetical protein [Anaerolineae bacterium]
MKRNYRILYGLVLVMLLALLLGMREPAVAQSYRFEVPELRMQVYVQPDASVKIEYDITFKNLGATIEVIDIGTPHKNYNIGNMSASMNGVGLNDIRKSTYIDTGVEIHLGSQAIPMGGASTLHFEFTMPDMVYQDTTRKDYASLQITPTWFDSSSVSGSTAIWVAIHMPEGVSADDMLYQKVEFTQKALFQGRAVAVWNWEEGRATQEYLVGVSFPQVGMDRVITMTLIDLMVKWMEDNPNTRMIMGLIQALLFGVLFFRFTGGTGCALFGMLMVGLVVLIIISPLAQLVALPLLVLLVIINEWQLSRRKKTYLPPIAQVEGGGIKRGLTAPEAATLLEMPLNKILTLVIFGLLAKGILQQVEDDPLKVEVAEPFRTLANPNLKTTKARLEARRQAAQDLKTIIHKYEDGFLQLLEKHPGKAVKDIDFAPAMQILITDTAEKMKGFDLSDTKEYYQRIMERAWQQAQTIGEIPQREEYLDKYLPWVMMNDNYPTVLTTGGYSYWPRWIRHSRPISTGGGGMQAPIPSGSGRPVAGGRTTLGDVGSSFAGWAQATAGGLAGAIMPGSLKVPGVKGGVVDLSGVDKVTGDVFEALSKSSSGGGGGGGGGGRSCACACAGCACACACAGGGR